ncbi:MAG: hypothetical protein CSA95_05960 [Bacteroidetes bacterium]|nr:MAG: hypothetical protein CSA95_05960 [Bacteroidota bacterium]PIE88733.1 MAG: hypothetical protein CSA04_00375 [Bacteroidota bacterium]
MKSRPTIFHLIPMLLILMILSAGRINGQVQRPIGTNLVGVSDWSTEFVFVDVMKQSRTWIPHELGPNADWDSGVYIPLDEDGYPLTIPYDNGIDPPQGIRTVMFVGLEHIFPGGEYRFMAEGEGEIELWGAASAIFQCPIDTVINVDNNNELLVLEILESDIANPIKDIHILMPGHHHTFEEHPFHPELLSFIDDFQVIRFMDWMSTNGSEVQEWADRNTPNYYTQTLYSGVSYEYLIELCNLTQKDLWVNIPHKASDNFITQFAAMLRDQADPNLKIYLEYSNEVWNGIFPQNSYAAAAAEELGYTGEPWELSWKFTAKRSADVFQIFEDVFVNDDRLIKVIPGMAANAWVNNFIISRFNEDLYNPTGVSADALAIAPYFGSVANAIGEAGLGNTITVEAILDSMELSMPETFRWMVDNKELANNYNLDLIAYEGGQHLVAYYPYNENEVFVNKLLEANRHPRMEALYCSYFDYWYDTVQGGMFAHFSSHGDYSKYGAWGIKETYEDVNSPKYLGVKNCVFSYNSTSGSENLLAEDNSINVYPSLVMDQLTIASNSNNYNVNIYDINGTLHQHITAKDPLVTLSTKQLPAGIYFVHIFDNTNQNIHIAKIIKPQK